MSDENRGYPRAPEKKPDRADSVSVMMSEEWARAFEKLMLNPRNLELAGPLLFTEDDLPSYIIGIKHVPGVDD